MNAVLALLALSAVSGFALRSLSWLAVAMCGVVLAVFSSAVLHGQGFSALLGIAIIAACLTVNQVAYLVAVCAALGRQEPMQAELQLPEPF
jgi:hypothetical protein